MKSLYAKIILLFLDFFAIFFSLYLAYESRVLLNSYFPISFNHDPKEYILFPLIYVIVIVALAYEEIYAKRYDFWHESRQVIRALGLSFLIVMSVLAMTKDIENFSRTVIVLAFVYMLFFLPLFKNIAKKVMFNYGLWQRKASILGDDGFLSKEIFENPYLGYVHSDFSHAKTVFINSKNITSNDLKTTIDKMIQEHHEVIFIPLINDYNMVQSHVYELSNTRTNLIVFKNRLKSKYRIILQEIFNYFLAILLLPLLLPILIVLALLIKKESPGPIFFTHNRVGKKGKIIPTLKFRSMYEDADKRLQKLLSEDINIKKEWEINFKLKNDPRVTRVGKFLRKTSLDELPQIFNVLKGEMSFVGPRPVVQEELDMYYRENVEYYFMVKPGITGLWQVSGRSDTDYDFRVETDKWYVRNWSLWLDIVILIKTVKVVIFRDGAY